MSYSNKKKKNANLWDEKTIAFIILSLDEARHIFVTKRWKLQEVIGSIGPQSIVVLGLLNLIYFILRLRCPFIQSKENRGKDSTTFYLLKYTVG
jgi:uncharacterized protein YhbP (UPF0306 family)